VTLGGDPGHGPERRHQGALSGWFGWWLWELACWWLVGAVEEQGEEPTVGTQFRGTGRGPLAALPTPQSYVRVIPIRAVSFPGKPRACDTSSARCCGCDSCVMLKKAKCALPRARMTLSGAGGRGWLCFLLFWARLREMCSGLGKNDKKMEFSAGMMAWVQ
jgi:hypothetical protein